MRRRPEIISAHLKRSVYTYLHDGRLYDANPLPLPSIAPGALPTEIDTPLKVPDKLPKTTTPNRQERYTQTPIYSSLTQEPPFLSPCGRIRYLKLLIRPTEPMCPTSPCATQTLAFHTGRLFLITYPVSISKPTSRDTRPTRTWF